MADELTGRTVALLVALEGTEDAEFSEAKRALAARATVYVVSAKAGEVTAVNHDLKPGERYTADKAFADSAADYDALVIPGGTVGADKLRADIDAVALIHDFFEQGKTVGACHAPWALIEAGVVSGRTLTSYPTLQTDLKNAGATWTDAEVVSDGGLITSRNPNDLPAFCARLIEISESGQGRSAVPTVGIAG